MGYPPQYPQHPYQPPPQWQPPPPVDPAQLRPSRLWYWLSPIPGIVGIVVAVLFIVMLVNRIGADLDRFTTSSPRVVHLEKGDERGIYVQVAGGRVAGTSSAIAGCTVRQQSSERIVPLREPSGTFTLTVNGKSYRELYHFRPSSTGNYSVSCEGPEGAPLAVGPHFGFKGLVVPIVGAILSFLVGIALSIVIAVVTAVRRSNHKRRLQYEMAQRQAGYPPAPPR